MAKTREHIENAVAVSAQLLTGGVAHERDANFLYPAILTHVPRDALLMREETFGPVAPLIRFDSEEEMIALAISWRVAEVLEFGIVGLNEGIISSEVAPFGGAKEYDVEREGAKYGIDDHIEIKYLCVGGIG